MKRRTFIKSIVAGVAGVVAAPLVAKIPDKDIFGYSVSLPEDGNVIKYHKYTPGKHSFFETKNSGHVGTFENYDRVKIIDDPLPQGTVFTKTDLERIDKWFEETYGSRVG